MTRWLPESSGGRPRGVRAVLRSWVEIVVRPHRFFARGVAPGDQAPGLTFALAVVGVAAGAHLATQPAYAMVLGSYPWLSLVVVWLLVVLVVAPLVLHLGAALATVVLMGVVDAERRGGVSETVQVLAYGSAPCALAGVPFAPLRVVCAGYGFVLIVYGTRVVHRASWDEAVAAAVLPGSVIFGYGFGGFGAIQATMELFG